MNYETDLREKKKNLTVTEIMKEENRVEKLTKTFGETEMERKVRESKESKQKQIIVRHGVEVTAKVRELEKQIVVKKSDTKVETDRRKVKQNQRKKLETEKKASKEVMSVGTKYSRNEIFDLKKKETKMGEISKYSKSDKVTFGAAASNKNIGGRGGIGRVEQILEKFILMPSGGQAGKERESRLGPSEPDS